ncbi:MAG: flippase-like domain-containing protein [Candidatus Levybacteria bacterium]|nr:flippase-like domain-containing protein [Candidatus Levybacteria bacterium]
MGVNKNQLISWGKFLIGWPISFVSILFILKLIADKSTELNINLGNISLLYLILGIFAFFIYFLMRSFLWQLELAELGYKINFRENTYRFSFSELKRYTPGNIWSFLGRAEQFSALGIDKKTLGVSIIADIQLVIIGCGIVSIFSIPWFLNPGTLQTKLISLLPLVLIATFIFFIVTGIIYNKKYSATKRVSNYLLPGFSGKSKIKLILFSVLTYFIFGTGNYFIFISIFSLGLNLFLILGSFFVFSLLIGYLSFITPMGLGVRELVVTLGLSQILSVQDAGAVSIFSRIILVISELIFLFSVLIWEKSYRKI